MAYGILIIGMSAFGCLIYFRTDPATLFKTVIKSLIALGIVTFLIQCLWSRMSIWFKRWMTSPTENENEEDKLSKLKVLKDDARSQIQQDHLQKAENYKDRILRPREEAKKQRKEEEYYKFMGPAWKGEGQVLGGEIKLDTEEECPTERAARHRIIRESINEEVLQAARQELQRRKKKKIQLPDEPPDGAQNCVLVMLRTPLGDIRQRRFKHIDTIQHVLDYMTYIGFHQKKYTLVTTYPRQSLSDQREVTLADMGIKTRITLNVEEKDWDSDE
ncbi:UBX domain-containing protein 8-like [Ylistrum balloti]|uniref:UBX domain-containing protein 8-like n=1 Tax=Ylistrum balloti TaxID=509963 RepID=UPI002905C16C|nr:UBX domain-containing protein 8-like [Ylistrum balloti]